MIDEKKLIEKIERMRHIVSKYSPDVAYACENLLCELKDYINDQPQVGSWIPVAERLPDNGYGVLVTVNGKHNNITFENALEIAEYDNIEGWIIEGYLDWLDPDVTAWMPLPEPYKESKEE